MEERDTAWLGFHLFYHEDLDRPIVRFVRPLVAELIRGRQLDGFFFVRYGLGGAHIRLRLQPRAGCAGSIAEITETRARDFLSALPSTAQLDPEAIRCGNAAILGSDARGAADVVYPDNSFLRFPFTPETERYGGPELLGDSLRFFAVSSVAAFEFLARHGEQPRSRQLGVALDVLAGQALGFAPDEEDLVPLLGYGVDRWGEAMPHIVAKADRLFAGQREGFRRLFLRSLRAQEPAARSGPGEATMAYLGEASRGLSRACRRADRVTRRRIGVSQLHMTANRLGLINAEEVYLSRLLARVAAELLAAPQGADGAALRAAWGARDQPSEAAPTLRELLPEALARVSS